MTVQACAEITFKGDPDRYAAAMAAPLAARPVLFPLYAFNVEVARAPWVASEPMIGEMRLQWWRDAVSEIEAQGQVRKHEVTTPLAEVIGPEVAPVLDALIAARRWDLYKDPFEDAEHFNAYLGKTGGGLMWAAAKGLGAPEAAKDVVLGFGAASALVRFLTAVPELEARGRVPLVDGRAPEIAKLAEAAMANLPAPGTLRDALPVSARAALLEGWQTRRLLKLIARAPGLVADGQLAESEFVKRLSLAWAAFRG